MPILNKSGLIDAVSKNTELPTAVVAKVIDSLQETVIETVADGTEVKLMGFLSIEPTTRSERNLKNPRTGEDILVPESKTVRVRAMKNFRDRVGSTD
jgi:DNA-binding protein HU-beta